jgi:hypothetical protein
MFELGLWMVVIVGGSALMFFYLGTEAERRGRPAAPVHFRPCPECMREVRAVLADCPHCGSPLDWRARLPADVEREYQPRWPADVDWEQPVRAAEHGYSHHRAA